MAKLFYFYAAMNSGKSTQLLQVAHNYTERDQNVLLLKPKIDTRTSNTIGSRIGISKACLSIDVDVNLVDFFKAQTTKYDCILVDEAQFLTEDQVWQLSDIVDKLHIPVMCYGLRTDFLGNLFEGSRTLLAIADSITEVRGICECGRKACMVARIDSNGNAILRGEQVCIGAEETYVSFCRACWKKKLKTNWTRKTIY
ncbi:thymidine kinase [Aeromonas phage Ahp1_CNU-2021]|nr:thymidine kinase [Aeromonas phage Ahp1_CNU-2021]